jgi:hypothetical protein
MSVVRILALLFLCTAALAASADPKGEGPEGAGQIDTATVPLADIALFDLHDPGLMESWGVLLATTPMLNGVLLPAELQDRLANAVATYRALTPNGQPAFFVATYFDLLSERLFAVSTAGGREISPMQVCPVFVSGADASVSELLAVASGLPEALFVHAAGRPERYRYLFLQSEFSHCNFLARTMAAYEPRQSIQPEGHAATPFAKLSFDVGESSFTAILSTKKELRALLETVGDADAIAAFRREVAGRSTVDEAEVLIFIRLLSLLATDGKSGYAAIPVLLPLIFERTVAEYAASTESLRIADALALAYRARELFRRIAPFAIDDTQDLLNAKLAVMQALAERKDSELADEQLIELLDRFVTGTDLLLGEKKMPLTKD